MSTLSLRVVHELPKSAHEEEEPQHLQPVGRPLNGIEQAIRSLDRHIYLPNSPQAFVAYLIGLLLIGAGLLMHIMLSAQILYAEVRLERLKQEYATVEQENGELIWQIARETNLDRLHQRVTALGYVPVEERQYVILPTESVTTGAMTGESATGEPLTAGPLAQEIQPLSPEPALAPASSTLAQAMEDPSIRQRLLQWGSIFTGQQQTEVVTRRAAPGIDLSQTDTQINSQTNTDSVQPALAWKIKQEQTWWGRLWRDTQQRSISFYREWFGSGR